MGLTLHHFSEICGSKVFEQKNISFQTNILLTSEIHIFAELVCEKEQHDQSVI